MREITDMQPSFSLTSSLDFDRLLKLWLVVARYGEMDMARWWNTQGMLGLIGIVQKHLQGTTYHLHSLRPPHADVWPNDDGYETLTLRQARVERDRVLQEKALVKEALRARQAAATARFLASLAETQLQWLKCQAKARVDGRPDAKFLQSRYPLYKAEEEELIHEWRDSVAYGETVPHITTARSGDSESPDA
jgi:hypothetical protein